MTRIRWVVWALGWVLLAASTAKAQQTCSLEGRPYPENAVVCSRGLELVCSNGVWQNNEGRRCDSRDGSYLSPLRPYQPKSDEPIPEYLREKYPFLDQH